jgi:hypothetical protein
LKNQGKGQKLFFEKDIKRLKNYQKRVKKAIKIRKRAKITFSQIKRKEKD